MDKEKTGAKKYRDEILAGILIIAGGAAFVIMMVHYDIVIAWFRGLIRVMMPLIIGSVIAYILRPLCDRLDGLFRPHLPEKLKGISDPLAVAISSIVALMLISILISLITPQLYASISVLMTTLPKGIQNIASWLEGYCSDNPVLINYINNVSDSLLSYFEDWTSSIIIPSLQTVLSGLGTGVAKTMGILKNIIIGLVFAVYVLLARHHFRSGLNVLICSLFKPRLADAIISEIRFADKVFKGFLSGKIIDSIIIGVICYIFCLVTSMPSTVLVSVIVGVTNVIPFFGPYIGAIPSILIILISNPVKALIFLVFIIILQQVDGNIIGPKILGNTTGLSGLEVLIAIILFGGLMGFKGMIVGVPLFAVILDIVKKYMVKGLKSNGREDLIFNENDKITKA